MAALNARAFVVAVLLASAGILLFLGWFPWRHQRTLFIGALASAALLFIASGVWAATGGGQPGPEPTPSLTLSLTPSPSAATEGPSGPPTVVPTSASPSADVPPSETVHYLATDLEHLGCNEGCGESPAEVNGETYDRPVNVPRNPGYRGTVAYNLGKKYVRLRAVAGLRDDSDPKARQRMEVYGDGRRLFSTVVKLGDPAPVDVNIRGVLRLELVAVTQPGDIVSATATWGDPRVVLA